MPYTSHTCTAVAIRFIEAICHSATWRSWILGYMRPTGIAKVVCRQFRKTSLYSFRFCESHIPPCKQI